MLSDRFMHPNHKREAQIAEEQGLTAEPQSRTPVTKPDPIDDIDRARIASEAIPSETKPVPAQPRPSAPSLPNRDRLDRERASDEGMIAPPSEP
jgi:hypothetical protein